MLSLFKWLDPEPTATSSEDEDKAEEANEDDDNPQELDPEDLDVKAVSHASIPEV
jgi:hypothetical protein